MAAELVTPQDELTGIPLSVAPPLEVLPRNNGEIANWHHLFHPSTAPELQSLGGWALRNSRIQLLPKEQHNFGRNTYHTKYLGPPLPAADDEITQFRLCILSCAGYISEKVIDLYGDQLVRSLTEEERNYFRAAPLPEPVTDQELRHFRKMTPESLPDRKLWRSLALKHEKQAAMSYNNFRYAYDPIRDFFTDYLLRAHLFDLPRRTIEKFLMTNDEMLKLSIGENLLSRAAQIATDDIAGDYKNFHAAGLLHGLMPPQPSRLVKSKLGGSHRRQQLLPRLETCLSSALEGAA